MTEVKYCTKEQVNKLLRLPSDFSSSTNPTQEQVNNLIHRKMALIDFKTKTAFREQQAKEYHNLDGYYEYLTGVRTYLDNRNIITPLDSSKGDSLKVWNGNSWEEYLGSRTEGRNNDFWIDEKLGVLFLKNRYVDKPLGIDITYRFNSGAATTLSGGIVSTDSTVYGTKTTRFPYQGVLTISGEKMVYSSKNSMGFNVLERGAFDTTATDFGSGTIVYYVPEDIEDCCAKMVAIDILNTEDWSSGGTTSGNMPSGQNSIGEKIRKWQTDINDVLARYNPTITAIR